MSKGTNVILCLALAYILIAPEALAQDARTFLPARAANASLPLMKAVQGSAVYRPSVRITQYRDEINWINESRTLSTYSSGRLTSRYDDVFDGINWQNSELREFAYSDDGTPASEIVYEWGGTAWVPVSRTMYDSQNGVFTQITEQSAAGGGAWSNEERTVLTIQDGLIVGGQVDVWLGEWTPQERFILDQQPNRVHEIAQVHDGSGWVNSSRFTYPQVTIPELYEMLQQLVVAFEDYEGMYFALQLPDATEQVWNGLEWENVTNQTTERFYELFTGRLMKVILTTQEWDGDTWASSYRMVVDYSVSAETAGLPTVAMMQVFDGSSWQDLFVETYQHRSDIGRIAGAVFTADSGEGPQEVSRTNFEWIDATSVGVEEPATPATFVLQQNVPNPFNPSTRISYTLSQAQAVQLSVYDLLGRQVELLDSGMRPVGEHAVTWDASAMPSGLYLYRLETADGVVTKTMVLLK